MIAAATLETRRVPQHLAPLRGQSTMLPWAFLLSGHADRKHLLGFLPPGNTAPGRQAKGDASGILGLAHAVLLGHPKERCDGIGADGHAEVIEPACGGARECAVQISAPLPASSGRGPGVKQRLTLGAGVVRQPLEREHLLARQQA